MRRLVAVLLLAGCAPAHRPSPGVIPTPVATRAVASLASTPSRYAVCLARCTHRQQVKPDHGPLTCAERCAAYAGQ